MAGRDASRTSLRAREHPTQRLRLVVARAPRKPHLRRLRTGNSLPSMAGFLQRGIDGRAPRARRGEPHESLHDRLASR